MGLHTKADFFFIKMQLSVVLEYLHSEMRHISDPSPRTKVNYLIPNQLNSSIIPMDPESFASPIHQQNSGATPSHITRIKTPKPN